MNMKWRTALAVLFLPGVLAMSALAAEVRDWGPILRGLANANFATREGAQRELEKVPASEWLAVVELADAQKDPEVTARLWQRLADMARERSAQQAAAQPTVAAHLRGRVVDTAGKPLVDFPITVGLPMVGEELTGLWTDGQGRFDAGVPFADIVYRVGVSSEGLTSRVVLPEAGGAIGDLSRPSWEGTTYRGIVLDGGKPVADQEVTIYQDPMEYWRRDRPVTVKTGADGTFNGEVPGRQGVLSPLIVVRHGDLAAPLMEQGRAGNPITLNLVKTATIQGVVRDLRTNKPMAHVHVLTGHSLGGSHFYQEAMSDDDGHYQITGVPPAASMSRMNYFVNTDYPGWNSIGQKVMALQPGENATVDVPMVRAAVVLGRVLDAKGKPVAGALVGVEPKTRLPFPDYPRNPWPHVETDAQGWYVQAVPSTIQYPYMTVVGKDAQGRDMLELQASSKEAELVAYSSKEGRTRIALGAFESGDLMRKDFVLAGSIRIRGTITDDQGRPLSEVACLVNGVPESALLPGADGRFDLGQVPLEENGKSMPAVLCLAPRSARTTGERYEVRSNTYDHHDTRKPLAVFTNREDAPKFYQHQLVAVKGAAGAAVELKVIMAPTQLLEFSGILLDAQGQPVADAMVILLTGEAKAESWLSTMTLFDRKGQRLKEGPPDLILGSAGTGADGRWRMFTVREDGTGRPRDARNLDWTTYALGALGGGHEAIRKACDQGDYSSLQEGFVGGVDVPKDTGKKDVTIRLGK